MDNKTSYLAGFLSGIAVSAAVGSILIILKVLNLA